MKNKHKNKKNNEKVPVVELYDENGEKIVFELLDTIEFEESKYVLLTPYFATEEEYDLDKPADVFIMKKVEFKGREPVLETVDDDALLQTVYTLFKDSHAGEFEFRDEA